jgi:hypothetical protein
MVIPWITGFVDFVHRPEFEITRKHSFSETGSVSIFKWREGDKYSNGPLESPNFNHWYSHNIREEYDVLIRNVKLLESVIIIIILDITHFPGLYLKQRLGDWILSLRNSSSIDLDQLSMFCLKTETESSLQNAVLIKDRTMDNIQNCNNCINGLSSQTYI